MHWPEAIRNGVVLKTRATVREITVNAEGLADGALYYDADGTLQEQKARIVVVACNGIGTPRLLLNSTSSRFPDGLANSSGLVGKGLMGQPKATDQRGIRGRGPRAGRGRGKHGHPRILRPDAWQGFRRRLPDAHRELLQPIAVALGTQPRITRHDDSGLARTWRARHGDSDPVGRGASREVRRTIPPDGHGEHPYERARR